MLLETFRGCLEGVGNNTISAGFLKISSVCSAYSKQMNGRSEGEGLFHPWFHASISLLAALIWWDFSMLKMLTSLLFVNVILDKEVYFQKIFAIDYLWAASWFFCSLVFEIYKQCVFAWLDLNTLKANK